MNTNPTQEDRILAFMQTRPDEQWKPVIGYEGKYSVSNLGRVAGHCGGRGQNKTTILRGGLKANGYRKVSFEVNGVSVNHYIHRLVLTHFGPPSNGKTDCNHIDGNKLNNRIENLEWATRSENMRHAMRTGLWSAVGVNNPQSILIPAQVKAIRQLLSEGKSQPEIANMFGVCRGTICNIKRNKCWRHVA